jgi:3-oxoacyl-[acyl-carrier protein] reductase
VTTTSAFPTPNFHGYRVIVTGGSKGIGRAMALAFAQAGASVSICARGEASLHEAHAALAQHGGQVHSARCDLADPAALKNYIDEAAAALGGIDVLINNASGYGFSDDEESWASGLNVDLLAPVRASRAALPYLKASSAPSIVHISSIAAFHASPRSAPYAAVKAALSQYTTSQALALASDRIRVNAIAPGSIEFADGLWERRREDEPALYQAVLGKIPFGRFGRPEEIAYAALFLASPWAGWITGQTLAVDGGQLLQS